ncbi:MAG TPA: DinB family protein [Pyrinomonadaceae bacterium]|nr:DinB family protein [Pyrinomonadaceae bacterium]
MNTIEHLRELFAYNDWANRRIAAALKSSPSEKVRKIFAHLLITEKEYFERLYDKDSTGFDFWQDLSLEDCANLTKENAENYERTLERFDDEGLGQVAKYKTSEGVAYQNTFRELLTHVLFHSSIHRGNIILKMREENYAPPTIDYIIYLREAKS